MVTPPTVFGQGNLESGIECVPHPGRGGWQDRRLRGRRGVPLYQESCKVRALALGSIQQRWLSAVLAIPQTRFDYNTGGIAVVLYRHQQMGGFIAVIV